MGSVVTQVLRRDFARPRVFRISKGALESGRIVILEKFGVSSMEEICLEVLDLPYREIKYKELDIMEFAAVYSSISPQLKPENWMTMLALVGEYAFVILSRRQPQRL